MSLTRFRSALSANTLLIDTLIALGLAALSLSSYAGGSPDVGPPGWATLAVLMLQSLPLVARRRYPIAVMVVIASALILQIALLPTDTNLSGGIGVLIATYTVGERVERRT